METHGITYKDLCRDLKDVTTYLNPTRKTVVQAFAVARQLDLYIEEKYKTVYPMPHVIASAATLEVCVGEIGLWSSESNSTEELTFEYCLEQLKEQIAGLCELL